MGKILIIEGTDCSGKETQTKMLVERLKNENYNVGTLDFPQYSSPTGRIIGGPYLGKPEICEGWFKQGANEVDPKVASLYYAADRRYHLDTILNLKKENDILVLDRYVYSNMAHQAGKIRDFYERHKMYRFLEKLEFELLSLPKPDKVVFLYMPLEGANILREGRGNLDEHEKSLDNQINAINTYLELVELYGFDKINCMKNDTIKSREEVHEEVYKLVKKMI